MQSLRKIYSHKRSIKIFSTAFLHPVYHKTGSFEIWGQQQVTASTLTTNLKSLAVSESTLVPKEWTYLNVWQDWTVEKIMWNIAISREYIYAIYFKRVSNVGNVKDSFTEKLLVVLYIGAGKRKVHKFCTLGSALDRKKTLLRTVQTEENIMKLVFD